MLVNVFKHSYFFLIVFIKFLIVTNYKNTASNRVKMKINNRNHNLLTLDFTLITTSGHNAKNIGVKEN